MFRSFLFFFLFINLAGSAAQAQSPAPPIPPRDEPQGEAPRPPAPALPPGTTLVPIVPGLPRTHVPVMDMTEPVPGDHWSYETHDEITGEIKKSLTHTVTDTAGTEISVRV